MQKIVAVDFAMLLRITTSTPPPFPLVANWPLIGMKLNCRQPLDNFELYNSLKLSFANIKDLRSNFVGCESFFESNSPDILVLCETNLDGSIDSGIFLCDRLSSFNLERFYNSVLQLM